MVAEVIPASRQLALMDRPLDPSDVRRITGSSRQYLALFFKSLGESARHTGRKMRRLSGKRCWQLLVARALLKRGESLDEVLRHFRTFDAWGARAIDAWMQAGATAIFITNGNCFGRLIHPTAPFTGEHKALLAKARQSGAEIRLIVMDTRILWAQVTAFVESLEEVSRD
jgi:hypothetical protein